MTTQALVSFIFTIVFIVFVCWGIFKRANNDHKARAQYDERQNAVRGKGFKYGFYTILVFQTLLYILETTGVSLPLAPFSLGFIGVILGVTVLAVYTVWNGAYWGLNNNRRNYIIFFVFFLLFNLIPIIGTWSSEGFLNVIQGTSLVNVGVEVMLIALGAALLLRRAKDKQDEAED